MSGKWRKYGTALGTFLILAGMANAQTGTPTGNGCSTFSITRDSPSTSQGAFCLGEPVLGFVFNNSSGEMNPVLGIPGSMRLDAPLQLGFKLDTAQVSQTQNYALGITGEDRKVILLDFQGRTVYVRDTGLPPNAATVSLSSTGNSAAFLYPSQRQVYVVSQLPRAPVSWIADASKIQDNISTLSVSDDGQRLIAGTDTGRIYSIARTGGAQLVANLTSPVLSSFLRNSHDAVIADETEKRLYYFSESAARAWGLGPSDDSLSPLGMAISSNNDRAFVVSSGSENIVSVNLATGQSTSTACNCVPRGLAPIYGDSLFRLTDVTDSSLLLFQPKSTGDEILFVPFSPLNIPGPSEGSPRDPDNRNADNVPADPEIGNGPGTQEGAESAGALGGGRSRENSLDTGRIASNVDSNAARNAIPGSQYEPQPTDFIVTLSSSLTDSPADSPTEEPAPASGKIVVTSVDVGGRLWIDGEPKGELKPDEPYKSSLSVRRHLLRLEPGNSDYEAVEQEVDVEADRTASVAFTPRRKTPEKVSEKDMGEFPKADPGLAPRTITLEPDDFLGLESGTKSKEGAHLLWTERDEALQLIPQENTQFVLMPGSIAFGSMTAGQLKKQEFGNSAFGSKELPLKAGMVIAVRLPGGNYAAIRVETLSREITIRWVIYALSLEDGPANAEAVAH